MIHEVLEVSVDLVAGIGGPHKFVGRVEYEGELVHLSLVELRSHGIDVRCIDPHMPRRAAEPLPAVLPAHVPALHIYLWLDGPQLLG